MLAAATIPSLNARRLDADILFLTLKQDRSGYLSDFVTSTCCQLSTMRLIKLPTLLGPSLALVTSEQITKPGFNTKIICDYEVYRPGIDVQQIRQCTSDVAEWTLLGKLSWENSTWDCADRRWTISRDGQNFWKSADDCIVSCRPCLERAADSEFSGVRCYAEVNMAGCTLRMGRKDRLYLMGEEGEENEKEKVVRRARDCILDPTTC